MPNRNELWSHLDNVVSASLNLDYVSWLVFSIFWAGNAIVATALLARGYNVPRGILVSSIGAFGSIVWWIIQARAVAYHLFRESIVAELEEYLLGSQAKTLFAFAKANPHYGMYLNATMRSKPWIRASGALFAHFWALIMGGFIGDSTWIQSHNSCGANASFILALFAMLAWIFFCLYCQRMKTKNKGANNGLWIISLVLGTLSIISFLGMGVFFVSPYLKCLFS